MLKKNIILIIIFFTVYTLQLTLSYAATKVWSGDGDGVNWSDANNWYPAELPTINDELLFDLVNGLITCDQTFSAKKFTIGGQHSTTVTTNSFVFGTIEPATTSDIAVITSSGGKLTLSGSGIITIKGQYRSSSQAEDVVSEPSFMFSIE